VHILGRNFERLGQEMFKQLVFAHSMKRLLKIVGYLQASAFPALGRGPLYHRGGTAGRWRISSEGLTVTKPNSTIRRVLSIRFK
jgi:hypothetical protein